MVLPKDFDIFGRIVNVHLTSRKKPIRAHFDLIKDYCLDEAEFRIMFHYDDSDEPTEIYANYNNCNDAVIETFIYWLYTGDVKCSDPYFDSVAGFLKLSLDTIHRGESFNWHFFNALIDHAMKMTVDPERSLHVAESIRAILEHAAFPEQGSGRFLVDWVVSGSCEVPSVFAEVKAKLEKKKEFQNAIAVALLDQKAEVRRDEGILPWNGDPCRYHVRCYSAACEAFRTQFQRGHMRASGVPHQFEKRKARHSEDEDEHAPKRNKQWRLWGIISD